jgi:pimeloyl-ACP methyl ester carboxylesterase
MPFADVPNGMRIYYEEHGSGEPVLLLMGTGADHTFWSPQIPAYSERHRTIVIDSRGTGQSTRPDDATTCTAAAMAEDARGVLDHLGIGRAHLGGLSLGSAVAQEFALRWPERLLSLALHGTWGRSDEWFVRAIDTLEVPAAQGDVGRYLYWALMWVLSPRFLAEQPDAVDEITRTYLDENPHPPTGPGIMNHTHADKAHDTLDRLHTIRVRTLVTAGEMDWLVPPRYCEEVARRIPGARYHLFRGDFSSHCACVEMAEEWNRVTLSFLAGDDVGDMLGP